MNKNYLTLTSKQLLLIVLFIESLVITTAFTRAVVLDMSPRTYFGEIDRQGYVTYFSFLQLVIAAVLAGKIFRLTKLSQHLQTSSLFWLVSSIGLFFLALDDIVGLHENIDLWLHDLLAMEETALTDLIDDFIVAGYLVFFIIFIIFQWQKLQDFRSAFLFFKLCLILAVVMIIMDIVSNNVLFFSLITNDLKTQLLLQEWIGAIEDSIKIFSEGMLIIGIYKCWQIASNTNSLNN